MTLHQLDQLIGKHYEHRSPCCGVSVSDLRTDTATHSAFVSVTNVEYCGDLVNVWAQERGVEPFFRYYGNWKDCPDIPQAVADILLGNNA